MKKVTMADVADLAGVSKSTVSAVINNKDIVKDSTRRRVLKAVDEMNYRRPRRSVQRGKQPSTGKSLGYVIKEAGNPYYAETLAGIQEVASKEGYLVFVSSSEGDYATEQKIVEQFAVRDFDGLIVTPILNDDTDFSHFFDLKRLNVPLILLESVRGIRASLASRPVMRAISWIRSTSHVLAWPTCAGNEVAWCYASPRTPSSVKSTGMPRRVCSTTQRSVMHSAHVLPEQMRVCA